MNTFFCASPASTATARWPVARRWACTTLAAVLLAAGAVPSRAHGGSSELSGLSLLPLAVVAVVPVALLSAGTVLTVVAVQTTARGSEWVLERGADGVRGALQFSGGAVVAVGTSVVVTVVAAGWVLSAAGQAIAFVPNEIGAALLHNERVSR